MNPWRAALTSATASGKSTRIASRKATACSSTVPVTCTCESAAEVSSTAVLSVSVANCSRCASCTVSACCSANSRKPRSRSSGSPPKGKPPSIKNTLAQRQLVPRLDLRDESVDDPGRGSQLGRPYNVEVGGRCYPRLVGQPGKLRRELAHGDE